MIVSYSGPTGRHVLFADANPAIGDLPVATMTPLTAAARAAEADLADLAAQIAEALPVREAPLSG
jgi:hypothetical protein